MPHGESADGDETQIATRKEEDRLRQRRHTADTTISSKILGLSANLVIVPLPRRYSSVRPARLGKEWCYLSPRDTSIKEFVKESSFQLNPKPAANTPNILCYSHNGRFRHTSIFDPTLQKKNRSSNLAAKRAAVFWPVQWETPIHPMSKLCSASMLLEI